MAFWNSKAKDKFEDVESVTIPTERTDATAVAVAVVPTVRHAASVIAAGAVVSGSITAPGDIQVEGQVIGDVRCATAVIGKDGDVKGNVVAETATIRGRVIGDVRARTIQLASTGSVEGDLSHAVLIIEEGGVFEGRSKRAADPLSELAIAAPAAGTATEAATVDATPSETDAEEKPVEQPVPEPEVIAAAEKSTAEPGKDLDEAPRSGVADALGEKFAIAS
jgi:cytoskeletal protein CcmA (bactofilin family)